MSRWDPETNSVVTEDRDRLEMLRAVRYAMPSLLLLNAVVTFIFFSNKYSDGQNPEQVVQQFKDLPFDEQNLYVLLGLCAEFAAVIILSIVFMLILRKKSQLYD